MINGQTYEEYFLLYIDGELNRAERAEVERFVEENPELKKELDVLNQSVFVADENIAFENKAVLYKKEEKAVIMFFNWKRMAAAAAVLIFFALGVSIYFGNRGAGNRHVGNGIASTVQQSNKSTEDTHIIQSLPEKTKTRKDQLAKNNTEKNTVINKAGVSHRSLKEKSHKAETKMGLVKNNIKASNNDIVNPENNYTLHGVSAMKQAVITNGVALADHSNESIKIAVQARHITSPQPKAVQNTIEYANENDPSSNNRIYIANTSFSKRNGLRVVFRKASRIIDRITTLQ